MSTRSAGLARGLGEGDGLRLGEGDGLRLGEGDGLRLGEGDGLRLGEGDGLGEIIVRATGSAVLRTLSEKPMAAARELLLKKIWALPITRGLSSIVARVPESCLPPDSGGAAKVKVILPFSILGFARTLVRKSP